MSQASFYSCMLLVFMQETTETARSLYLPTARICRRSWPKAAWSKPHTPVAVLLVNRRELYWLSAVWSSSFLLSPSTLILFLHTPFLLLLSFLYFSCACLPSPPSYSLSLPLRFLHFYFSSLSPPPPLDRSFPLMSLSLLPMQSACRADSSLSTTRRLPSN